MPFTSVIVNVSDVARSVDFYTRYLGAEPLHADDSSAELDLGTGTLQLQLIDAEAPVTTWLDDDRQRGFRHIGFKVDELERWTDPLQEVGVRFHIEPCSAVGGLRIAFFYDPDGTLLELVENNPEYNEVLDEDLVQAERSLPRPDRPRFDHVALSVADVPAAIERWRPLGFQPYGTLEPPGDERGLHLTCLRSGDTVLELFSFTDPTFARKPQLDAPGFQAAVVDVELPFPIIGSAAQGEVHIDDDGLAVISRPD